jgi:diadenosine tetraphosphate (Ap4A) HIT family hydrolase
MKLKDFVTSKMRMAHIYQPVMIKSLLEHEGKLDVNSIAKAISLYDIAQVEYYEKITHNMVGKVLRSHDIVKRDHDEYELTDFSSLSNEEVKEIIHICDTKLDAYISKRGDAIWEHRRKNRQPVSGSIRYQVLKRAKFRCECCGISAEEKALEVDHITPKNWGGEDSINNYQALCYTCNAQKKDTDDTNFGLVTQSYAHREEDCIFCNPTQSKIVYQNNLSFAINDSYPVTRNHLLVIPKRHALNYFELHQAEINAVNAIIFQAQSELSKRDSTISGYNIGANNGRDAGQTIFHCHLHLIPRRQDDVMDPIGGVRNVIPGKGNYIHTL